MRETVGEWRREWIETNGETDELEVVIQNGNVDDSSSYVYEGSFKDIPDGFLDKKVIESGKILDSSVTERIGAYSLTVMT